MKDPRGPLASITGQDADRVYPCLKVYATIDAPVEQTCAYLSQEAHLSQYNDLVVKHRDLEEITPASKITWGMTPQILFVKPREFVTYCHHRWLRDGTQIVINQATEHSEIPEVKKEGEGKALRAHALRGANYMAPDPDDPQKTRMCILAHASPGGIPEWACKTAVNALLPIEPFKLFYKINQGVKGYIPSNVETERVSLTGRSSRAGGLSQMGYGCFWPQGGGIKEGIIHSEHPQHTGPPEENSSEQESLQSTGANTSEEEDSDPDIL